MKKLALLLILLLPILAGCHSSKDNMITLGDMINPNEFSATTNDSVVHRAAAEATDETLLYIINEPTEDEIDELLAYQLLKLEDEAPISLLIPRRQNTEITIYPLLYVSDAETYQRGLAAWSTDSSSKGLVVAMQAERGETGFPAYEIYVESNGYYTSYLWEVPTNDDGTEAELPQFEMVEIIAALPDFGRVD